MRTPFMVALLGLAWLALTLIAVTTASTPWRVVLTVAAAVYGYAYGWTLRDSEIEGGE
jgi:hypothetical protein|nr:MAG TPA: hypothetical protein [Caudoviricetes sp.]DAN58789.1 MAG TPA: hypothetical protein [Caudoviricetes sp.]